MELHLLNRSCNDDRSIRVSHECSNNFLRVWHHHEELELVLVQQSTGVRFVGDSIEKFRAGELVLLGKNVPHMWLNDDLYFQEGSSLSVEAVAVHFKQDFLGADFLQVPEMQLIAKLLSLATRGIKFSNPSQQLLHILNQLPNLDNTSQVIEMIDILRQLSLHQDIQFLSSSGFINTYQKTENRRLDRMYKFIFQHFNTPIGASEIAEHIGMNKAAFSRFFKKLHRKPFTKYLNEIRVGYACKLLLEEQESITSIAYLSGFNNISNFNRQFKLIKGMSPSSYLESHKQAIRA
ncbi:MAG: AraC family transcriptional regulator [Bacteroidota bacterium]